MADRGSREYEGAGAQRVEVIRSKGDQSQEVMDSVAAEEPLTLFYNGDELVSLLCTPQHKRELAVGFMYGEGLLGTKEDILTVAVDDQRRAVFVETVEDRPLERELLGKGTITSGCGRGSTFSLSLGSVGLAPIPVPSPDAGPKPLCAAADITSLMRSFQRSGELFLATGGTHCVALAEPGQGLIIVREDVGRHNALDKIVGHCLLAGVEPSNMVLLTTGRVSSEILLKTARARVPILVSRSAPTSLALEYALELGVTVVGFARGERMNIYTYPRRIARPWRSS